MAKKEKKVDEQKAFNDFMSYADYGNMSHHSAKMNKDNAKRLDRYSSSHLSELKKYVEDSIKDDTKRMVRCFPTFRLYFVETDAEQWSLYDDFYGYNSVESIQIHKSKENAADTAVIKVTNFKGHLDNKDFESDKHARKAEEKVNPLTGKMESPDIENMYLYPGTQVQVKMGYTSKEGELANVFTGKITEIKHGDVITMIAQGYGVELLQPKGYDWNRSKYGGNPFGAWKADPLNIMNMLICSREVKHFGRWGFGNIDAGEIAGFRAKGRWVSLLNKPQDDNIYLERKERSTVLPRIFGIFNEYRIYQTTAWRVFKDMEKRFPGYCVAAVPYDARATLFFGQPNQFYNYTTGRTDARSIDYVNDEKNLEYSKYEPMLQDENYFPFRLNDGLPPDVMEQTAKDLRSLENKVNSGDISEADADKFIRMLGVKSQDDRDEGSQDDRKIIFVHDPELNKEAIMSQQVNSDKFVDFIRAKLKENPKEINKYLKMGGAKTLGISTVEIMLMPPDDLPDRLHGSGAKLKNNNLWARPDGDIKTWAQILQKHPLATGDDPRYKPFRSYHWKDSFHHIVANNIQIELKNFYNRIVVEFYSDIGGATPAQQQRAKRNYVTVMADDSIPPDYWRTKVCFEPNAERYYQARNYALGNLNQTLKKLYGGDLIILGDPDIKPHDIVYLNDTYTGMYGPIEVREVVHNLTMDGGFTTTIIPDLVVHINNPTSIIDTWMVQGVTGLMAAVAFFTVGAVLFSGIVGAAVIAGAVSIPCVRDTYFPTIFGKLGFSDSIREPIGITPLVYMGKPYVAGFEGMKSEAFLISVADKIEKYVGEYKSGKSFSAFMVQQSIKKLKSALG